MKPFIINLKLVIKNNVGILHDYFTVVGSSYKDVILSGESKYICLYNFKTIIFEYLFMIF